MPADRFIHPKLGHSNKVSGLTDFEYRVWTQYLLSADDFGVMRASAVTLQADNDALHAKPTRTVQRALDHLVVTVGLLHAFEHQGRRYVYQRDWQDFQKVDYPRATIEPKPGEELLLECSPLTQELFAQHPGGQKRGAATSGPLAQHEKHIRGTIADRIGSIWTDVREVAENVRLANSYADIVVTRAGSRLAVIEVKRHTIYRAAVAQVKGYGLVLQAQYPSHHVENIVIGRGVAASLDAAAAAADGVTLVTMDDALDCAVVARANGNDLPERFSLTAREVAENLTVTQQAPTTRARARETATATAQAPAVFQGKGSGENPPRSSAVGPLVGFPRLRVFRWMVDELLASLGGVDFDLDGWLRALEDDPRLVIPADRDARWTWLRQALDYELRKAGLLPAVVPAPVANKRIAGLAQGTAAFLRAEAK